MAYGAKPLEGPATFADIEALPEGVVGEIIDGTLYTHARPRAGHMDLVGALIDGLRGPFQRGQNGPGGWWVLAEPGIEVEGAPEFNPDLAGWRRERMPVLPDGRCKVVPDWACEILSPSTRAYDTRIKRPFYARIGIQHLWFIDPEARMITLSELQNGFWVDMGSYGDDEVIRAPPFDAIELRLGGLWKSLPPPD